MYQKMLLAVLIGLGALRIVATILDSGRLVRLFQIVIVLFLATVLILWVTMGWSPIPGFVVKGVRWFVHLVSSETRHLSK
jgi:hypothetical protein